VVAKYVAGRDKDYRFIEAALRHRLLDVQTLRQRLLDTELPELQRERILQRIQYDEQRTS
jgi:hypothetical protein